MFDRSAPTSAWAGLVVLGNGDLVPFRGGVAGEWSGIGPAFVALVLALVVCFFWLLTRNRV